MNVRQRIGQTIALVFMLGGFVFLGAVVWSASGRPGDSLLLHIWRLVCGSSAMFLGLPALITVLYLAIIAVRGATAALRTEFTERCAGALDKSNGTAQIKR